MFCVLFCRCLYYVVICNVLRWRCLCHDRDLHQSYRIVSPITKAIMLQSKLEQLTQPFTDGTTVHSCSVYLRPLLYEKDNRISLTAFPNKL